MSSNEELINQMMEMGFERDHVKQAIYKTKSTIPQRLLDYLFENPYDP